MIVDNRKRKDHWENNMNFTAKFLFLVCLLVVAKMSFSAPADWSDSSGCHLIRFASNELNLIKVKQLQNKAQILVEIVFRF